MATIKMYFRPASEWPADAPKPSSCLACHGSAAKAVVMVVLDGVEELQGQCGLICRGCEGTSEEMTDRILRETEAEGLC
jgi:hypothetical protein